MNELLLDLPENIRSDVEILTKKGNLPHAIILEGKNNDIINKITKYIVMYALCQDKNKPCLNCISCQKVERDIHPDVYRLIGTGTNGKSGVNDIRRLCNDTYTKPNEGSCKVYILPDCDMLNIQSQNAFLKSLEEPIQRTLYILQCNSAYSLLETIRSRCVKVNADHDNEHLTDLKVKANEMAKNIVNAICETTELPLLKATYFDGKDRDFYIIVINELKKILISACTNNYNSADRDIAVKIKNSIDTKKVMKMIQVTDDAILALKRNANMNLFSTWLCMSLRAIKEH